MKHKKISKKSHSVGSILLIIALITAFFAAGLYTSGNGITGAAGLEIITGRSGETGDDTTEDQVLASSIFSEGQTIQYGETFNGKVIDVDSTSGNVVIKLQDGSEATVIMLQTIPYVRDSSNVVHRVYTTSAESPEGDRTGGNGGTEAEPDFEIGADFKVGDQVWSQDDVGGTVIKVDSDSNKITVSWDNGKTDTFDPYIVNTKKIIVPGIYLDPQYLDPNTGLTERRIELPSGDFILSKDQQIDSTFDEDLYSGFQTNDGMLVLTSKTDEESMIYDPIFEVWVLMVRSETSLLNDDQAVMYYNRIIGEEATQSELEPAPATSSTIPLDSESEDPLIGTSSKGVQWVDIETGEATGTGIIAPSSGDWQTLRQHNFKEGEEIRQIIIEKNKEEDTTRVRIYEVEPKTINDDRTFDPKGEFEYKELLDTYELDARLLEGASLDKWNGNIKNIPLPNNGERSIILGTDTQSAIDMHIDKETNQVVKERALVIKGDTVKEQVIERELIELKDGSTQSQITSWVEISTVQEGDEKITYRTTRHYNTFDENGIQNQNYYVEIKVNDVTKEPVELTIVRSDGTFTAIIGEDGELIGDEPAKAELSFLRTQHQSRQFFALLDSVLTSYSGLGYYATLFFDDEDLSQWKESVDQAFATLYLGTEYWESEICSLSIDRDQQGVAYIDTRLGLAAVAAHIEATRSPLIILPPSEGGGREFLYKITFNVKNGEYDKDPKALEVMRFNVILKGERTAKLFGNDIEVKRGNEFGVLGNEAIVQFSNFFYDEICIKFEDVPSFWTLDEDELCNKIIGAPSSGEPIGSSSGEGAQESQGDNVLDI